MPSMLVTIFRLACDTDGKALYPAPIRLVPTLGHCVAKWPGVLHFRQITLAASAPAPMPEAMEEGTPARPFPIGRPRNAGAAPVIIELDGPLAPLFEHIEYTRKQTGSTSDSRPTRESIPAGNIL
jgi:hypothetical protein